MPLTKGFCRICRGPFSELTETSCPVLKVGPTHQRGLDWRQPPPSVLAGLSLASSIRSVVTAIAPDHRAAREEFPGQCAVGLHSRQDRSAVVRPVAGLTGRLNAVRHVLMRTHPRGADRVHSVRAAVDRIGHRGVARCALCEYPYVPLQIDALDVVVGVHRLKLGMCGAVAGFTLQATVFLGEAKERQPRGWGVRVGGERLIGGDAHYCAAGER